MAWSDVSKKTSTWKQLQPYPGFSKMPFGDPSNNEFKIYQRGWGDPTTKYNSVDKQSTAYNDISKQSTAWSDVSKQSTTWSNV